MQYDEEGVLGSCGRLRYERETYKIRGAAFAVYSEMGSGFLEAVYQECLGIELHAAGITVAEQPVLQLSYKGSLLTQTYRPDFICFDKIIVEIKAVSLLNDAHRAQLHNYLKTTEMELGLLINFGHHPKAQIERIIY